MLMCVLVAKAVSRFEANSPFNKAVLHSVSLSHTFRNYLFLKRI